MLVLSRKINEDIVISDNIVVRVLRVRGDKVRIGIEAPQHVKIIRSELQPAPDPAEPETPATE